MIDQFSNGAAKTLAVADTSVSLLAADVKPTSGEFQGLTCEVATIQAIGPLYVETGGAAATTASYPMAAGDVLSISGYQNIKKLKFIRNTNTTSIVWIPSYR
jgi:hypothetical protein